MSASVLEFTLDPHGGLRLDARRGHEARDERSGGGAAPLRAVLESRLLEPYDFGGFSWDPIEALSETLARMGAELRTLPEGERERAAPDAAPLVLWCRVEIDLARFARDALVRGACDAASGSDELARFAALNGLWRDLHRAVAPAGLVPRRWKRWLDGLPYEAPRRPVVARRAVALFSRVERAFGTRREPGKAAVARGRVSSDTASWQSLP